MSLPTTFFIGRGGGAVLPIVYMAMVGGGGGGGDGNAPGGGGGGGGVALLNAEFPLNTTIDGQIGAGGREPTSGDQSGTEGGPTWIKDSTGAFLHIQAGGGGRGGSYATAPSNGWNANGGGGSGPSNHNTGNSGGTGGNTYNNQGILANLNVSYYANGGGNYSGSYTGGGGGGAGGAGGYGTDANNGAGDRLSIVGYWLGTLTWGGGGGGANGGTGHRWPVTIVSNLGHGGGGSFDNHGYCEQSGVAGAMVIKVPNAFNININNPGGVQTLTTSDSTHNYAAIYHQSLEGCVSTTNATFSFTIT